jgi:hypothetical protein
MVAILDAEMRGGGKELGHKDVRTTMIYTHVLNRGGRGIGSPADILIRRSDERY